MTRFVSTRYPQLRIPALRVRFRDGQAEVSDPGVAARLASWPTQGVGLAPGESLPNAGSRQEEREEDTPTPDQTPDGDGQGDGGDEPKRPAKTAPKAEWMSYVLATYDVARAEVDGMTKGELMQLAED